MNGRIKKRKVTAPGYADSNDDLGHSVKKGKLQVFDTGATREPIPEHPHFICPELELRLSRICADGFGHYPDKDIEYAELSTGRRGLTKANLRKHAINHWNLHRKGDKTEDHKAKVIWALMMEMHFECDPPCQHFNELLEPQDRLDIIPKGFGKE